MADYVDRAALRDSISQEHHFDLSGDIVASAREKLRAALSSAGMIGSLVGKDPTGGAFTDGWVFSGFDSSGVPYRDVDGTGKACIVLHANSEWGSNQHNTMEFPVLTVLVYADNSRASDGTITFRDATLRARKITKVVVRTFHDAANVDHVWPLGVRVISSVRDGGTAYDDVPNSDGVIRAMTRFEVAT